jgi:hypothetical protein
LYQKEITPGVFSRSLKRTIAARFPGRACDKWRRGYGVSFALYLHSQHWGETAMGYRYRRQFLIGVLCFALLSSTLASAQGIGNAYDRGYREGIQQGEEDGRDGRAPQAERNSIYRDGDRGYQGRYGNRDVYRDEFRRGFTSGYREGYDRYRVNIYEQGRRDNRRDPRVLRGYQDPAFARGYSDGWDHGAEDQRDRDRYDPVRHGDYRDGDDGYSRSYGSRDAYKNNYRAGFRQGYEEGYRNGTRYRR